METEEFQIQVRRHPLIALLFIALGLAAIGLGVWIEEYGFVIVGAPSLVFGGFIYMNAAIVVTQKSLQLRNMFGKTGRVIPHDGLNKLQIKEGQLVIESNGSRATLPRPKAGSLHPADWKFLEAALEKARHLHK